MIAEPVLEPDDRAVVEAEGVLRELAEAAAPQVAREPVRDLEIALVPLERHRRLHVDDGLIQFAPAAMSPRAASAGWPTSGGAAGACCADAFEQINKEVATASVAGNSDTTGHRARTVARDVPRGSALNH